MDVPVFYPDEACIYRKEILQYNRKKSKMKEVYYAYKHEMFHCDPLSCFYL